jgi:hypothetical protein
MTYAKTVIIPADRRVVVDVPREIPAGATAHFDVVWQFEEGTAAQDERVSAFGDFDEMKQDKIALEKAAEMMAVEYFTDAELTTFCALDGEDFCETR